MQLFKFNFVFFFKVPLTSKYLWRKLIFAPVGNALQPFFLHCLTNPAFLYASKHAKNQVSFVHDRARSGSSPDLTSQSTLHACLQRVNAM